MEHESVHYSISRCRKCPITFDVVNEKLLCCRNCSLVYYCGVRHQKIDWPDHKQFCNAIHTIRKFHNIKHILDINGPIKNKSRIQFRKVIILIQATVTCLMKRELKIWEREATSMFKVCYRCYDYINPLLVCLCNIIYYCPTHQIDILNIEKRNEHNCEELKLYNLQFKIDVNDSTTLQQQKHNIEDFPTELCHLISQAYQKSIKIPCNEMPDSLNFDNIYNLNLISHYSHIATILFVIHISELHKRITNNSMIIHIIGASSDILLFDSNTLTLFLSWLPKLQSAKLLFIGPEVIACSDGNSISKRIEIKSFQMKYEQFIRKMSANDDELIRPDLILSFNCGFSEYKDCEINPWIMGLNELNRMVNIPIAITSYTKTESNLDFSIVRDLFAKEFMDKTIYSYCHCLKNTYRDHRPLYNWEHCDNEYVFYINGFINIFLIKDK